MSERIPKPEGVTWTDEQWEAIAVRGCSSLVAAAAGSGKTAVLVERIIRRISDPADPLDVDRLLVATFTNAAAAEMRHRIAEGLEKALAADPASDHLRRQLALLPRASITTLHSFCLEVVERHAQKIGLDPGFRIANETEIALLRQEVLEELFEEEYGAEGETGGFWRLADMFSGDKNDDALFALVQRVYDFSRSHPWPRLWLREAAEAFARGLTEDDPWTPQLRRHLELTLEGVKALLADALRLTGLPGGPEPYAATLEDDLQTIAYLQERCGAGTWEQLYHAFQGAGFGKLKACRGDQYDKELQEKVKELRSDAKDKLAALKEELFGRTAEQFDEELKAMAPLMDALVKLVETFDCKFREVKRDKRLVDFADLEHYCLHILRAEGEESGRLVPSAEALEYREQFAEVLLDEYQDTNRVQEAIVALISRSSPGNRFMVGDVKQSIYRFRLAEPTLFQEKYKAFVPGGGEPGARIDLARNFRSRRQVTDGTNFIFRQVMREKVGEIDYDGQAELVFGAAYYPEDAGDERRWAPELIVIDRSSADSDSEAEPRAAEAGEGREDETSGFDPAAELKELETAQLEARLIAARIRELTGMDGGRRFQVFDKDAKGMRDIAFRDIVILLRATQQWAPVLIEELKRVGIPAYAELSTGYFEAIEVQVMLSLLKLIDNPYQDIPLAGVLRSPIVGCSAEELALIRSASPGGAYYDAVRKFVRAGAEKDSDLQADGHSKSDGNLRADGSPQSGGRPQADDSHTGGGPEGDSGLLAAAGPEAEVGLAAAEGSGAPAEQDGALAASDSPGHTGAPATVAIPAETAARDDAHGLLRAKLRRFLEQLKLWRMEARQGSLAELIWRIYRTTGYFDFVGGLPGGIQRQANLRALYDRARQYEATSFRGLFRFLRFVERMQDSGGDLGTARALGEQENVVRIMTIHKSKGLEFPVVFAAGLAKSFNRRDLTASFLLHRELGFGPKLLEADTRVSYPTLPWLAIRRKIELETLAEEMRVLYVALTRAREKLYLIATVKDAGRQFSAWERFANHEGPALPDDAIAAAKCYLDWIGPALVRHPEGQPLRAAGGMAAGGLRLAAGDPSIWTVRIVRPEQFAALSEAAAAGDALDERLQSVLRLEPVDETERWEHEVWRRLSWTYPYEAASGMLSKTSVTELKRLSEHHKLMASLSEGGDADLALPEGGLLLPGGLKLAGSPAQPKAREGVAAAGGGSNSAPGQSGPAKAAAEYRPAIVRRPRFLEQRKMTAAERGTVFHSVMQHIPLDPPPTEETVRATLQRMVERELLTEEQRDAVDAAAIAAFFRTELGLRLVGARQVRREVPFSFGLPASDVYGLRAGPETVDVIMLQGVIDCVFEEESGLVLLDYKTDQLKGRSPQSIAEGYRLQLELYARAVERIWKRPVIGKFIYLFDGSHIVEL